MTKSDQHRHRVAEIAAQAVYGDSSAILAQSRLQHVLGPHIPALLKAVAAEHAAHIRSFVNADRIDIQVTVVMSNGSIISNWEDSK